MRFIKTKNLNTTELPLEELCEISSAKYNPLKDCEDYKCIELEHINQKDGTINGYVSAKEQSSIKNKFDDQSVLFGKLRAYLRKFYKPNYTGVCSSEIWVLKPKANIDRDYLFYLIQSNKFLNTANISCGSKMPRADWNYMKQFTFLIPEISEQNKIATFLNLYYKKIELQKKKIELIQRFLDREINDISHICEDYILFKDCYIKAGEGGTPSTSIPEFYDNGSIPFAKIEDLSKKYLFDTSSFITELGVQKSGAWIIPKNSVIYSNGATIGEVSINKIEVTTKQGILGIVPKKNISEEFLYYYMKSQYFRKEICKITTFGTMLSAYLKDIDKIKLFIPEFKLQENILCKINRINKKLDLEKKKLILLERYKQGLLQQLFV